MKLSKMTPRKVLTYIVTGIFALISGLIILNFQALAAHEGWDQYLINSWPSIRKILLNMGWQDCLLYSFIFSLGATIALWINQLLPQKQADSSIGENSTNPKYDAWDSTNIISLGEAAFLWGGYEPGSVDKKLVSSWLIMLIRAVKSSELEPADLEDHHKTLYEKKIFNFVDARLIVNRKNLRNYAEKKGLRPSFLFPEDRGKLPIKPEGDEFTSMNNAASEIFSELSAMNHLYAIAAKQIGKTEDGILSYMAHLMAPKTNVYGVPSGGNKSILISKNDIQKRLRFKNSGNDLYENHKTGIIQYSHCVIKKNEIERLILEMKQDK